MLIHPAPPVKGGHVPNFPIALVSSLSLFEFRSWFLPILNLSRRRRILFIRNFHRRDASRLQQRSSRVIRFGRGLRVFSATRCAGKELAAAAAHSGSHPMQQDACVLACQGPSFSLPLSPSVMVMLVMPFRKTSHFRCVIFLRLNLWWDRAVRLTCAIGIYEQEAIPSQKC